jgi:hypothetical protein
MVTNKIPQPDMVVVSREIEMSEEIHMRYGRGIMQGKVNAAGPVSTKV